MELDQEILEEIKERRIELEEDYEYETLKVNEALRDEYADYPNELIELGINQSAEELGLAKQDKTSILDGVEPSDNVKSELIESVLKVSKRLKETKLALEGLQEIKGELQRVNKKRLVPEDEINFIMEFLKSIYSPQRLLSKIDSLNTKRFDDYIGKQLKLLNSRLGEYRDDIISYQEQERVMQLVIDNCETVRHAIKDGRLGDILRDMVIGSYNEKSSPDVNKSQLKELADRL